VWVCARPRVERPCVAGKSVVADRQRDGGEVDGNPLVTGENDILRDKVVDLLSASKLRTTRS
jgi:hypothetical protein